MRYWILGLLAACSGDKGESAEQTTDSAETTATVGMKPLVTGVTGATCSTNDSNPDAVEDSWLFTVTYDDPQGIETVTEGSLEAWNGDTQMTSAPMACSNGMCVASTRSSITGITCDMKGALRVIFSVRDADGHPSVPYEYLTE